MFKPIQKGEKIMNKLFKTLSLLAALAFFATACIPAAVDVAQAAPAEVVGYQAVLGKSVGDQEVADFIVRNNCSNVAQFQLCRSVGMTLWTDANQKIQSVFLYPGDRDGFTTYQGPLPFGLRFTDTMGMVEQKLGYPVEIHVPQAGREPRLPDEGVTPDHFHYVATYESFGMTVIYNSPAANDKNATIYAILVSK
jgi:hypothetical protein